MRFQKFVWLALACGIAATAGGPARAQEFPQKAIRLIVPSGPGNTQDLVARVLAQEMAKPLKQPVVVENKPGAAQLLGYEYVGKSVGADGYTLVVGNAETMATLPLVSLLVSLLGA